MKMKSNTLASLVLATAVGGGLVASCFEGPTRPKPEPIPKPVCVTSDTLADFAIRGRGLQNFKFNGYDCSVYVGNVLPREIAMNHATKYSMSLEGTSGDIFSWSELAVIDSLPYRIFINNEGDAPRWNDEDQSTAGALEIYEVTGCINSRVRPFWEYECPAGYDTSTVSFRVLKCKEQ